MRCKAGAVRPRVKHAYIYITRVFLNRITLSHASEKSSSKMAVHACGSLICFHYTITRVSAETSAHGEISAQREQYLSLFKCTSIFSV